MPTLLTVLLLWLSHAVVGALCWIAAAGITRAGAAEAVMQAHEEAAYQAALRAIETTYDYTHREVLNG